jgi:hypothetical protein
MRFMPLVLGLAIAAGGGSAFAETHSDYTKSFNLHSLKTFDFKTQRRISRDPLADNAIWANDVRDAIRNDLSDHGFIQTTTGQPDFYVAFYVGLQGRYDMAFVDYGVPPFRRGLHRGWWGWPRGYDAWAIPLTESTVIVDVIDARTNQLVWRGYDIDTLNKNHPDKTLTKAADSALGRFYHDARKADRASHAD